MPDSTRHGSRDSPDVIAPADASPTPAVVDLCKLRVAIVHYWLVERRGGEKVIEGLCELLPTADIFTHVLDRRMFHDLAARHRVETSFIQKLPFARRAIQFYLPLMPLALEQFDFSAYDLVISSESGPAKGIITPDNCIHICYCHSPMRYIWNKYSEYVKSASFITRFPMRLMAHYLRMIDFVTAARVDYFIANSTAVARRIKKYYRRSAQIVYPPVDVSAFEVAEEQGYYLYCGQLTAYKRPDMAVDAFNELGLPLRVIGGGEMRQSLQKRAKPNIEFLGRVSDEEVRHNLARCRALVFPGEEDFGIVPVEAMASGRPVIAFARGGALDTVMDGVTGALFRDPSVAGLCAAVRRFDSVRTSFDSKTIVEHARRFDKRHFHERMTQIIQEALADRLPA